MMPSPWMPSCIASGNAFSIPSLTPYIVVPVPPKVKTPADVAASYPTSRAVIAATEASVSARP